MADSFSPPVLVLAGAGRQKPRPRARKRGEREERTRNTQKSGFELSFIFFFFFFLCMRRELLLLFMSQQQQLRCSFLLFSFSFMSLFFFSFLFSAPADLFSPRKMPYCSDRKIKSLFCLLRKEEEAGGGRIKNPAVPGKRRDVELRDCAPVSGRYPSVMSLSPTAKIRGFATKANFCPDVARICLFLRHCGQKVRSICPNFARKRVKFRDEAKNGANPCLGLSGA